MRVVTRNMLIMRLFSLLLALHFLNHSIDPRDPHPDTISEDLSRNDIESLAEFIAEVVLDQVNLFGEHDEQDQDGGSHGLYKFYCSTVQPIEVKKPVVLSSTVFALQTCKSIPTPAGSVTSPPPKV